MRHDAPRAPIAPAQEHSVPTQATTPDNANRRAGLAARRGTLPPYILTFISLAAAVVGFIWYDLRVAYRNTLACWQARQSSIAEMGAHRVSDWLSAPQEDVQLVAAHPSVRAVLRARYGSRRTGAAQREALSELTAALDPVTRLYPYAGVYVLDRDAQAVAQSSRSAPLDPSLSDACKAAARAGALRIEARGDSPDRSLTAFIAPVYPGNPPDSSVQTPLRAVGVVLTLLDPSKALFSLVTQESVATRTGETILVRREGNDLVCFGPLRHTPAGCVNRRFPLSAGRAPARLSLQGRRTFIEFNDGRGVPVLAATQSIPPASWEMVCKIDRAEALADFRRQVTVEALAGVLLIVLLGGLLSFHRREVVTAVLKEEGAEFRALFELAPDAIYMIEPSTLRILARNRKAAEMDGYSDEEVAGMTIRDLHPPEEHHLLPPHKLENPPESGVALPTQILHHVRKDGKLVPVEESQGPFGVGDQRFWLIIIRDLSERKQAEAALRESEERYRDSVEHSQDLICTHDLTGKLLSVNPAPARILGYTPDELLKIPMREHLAPEVRDQFDEYLEGIKRDGSARGLLAVRTRAGETRIWEYSNTLLREGFPAPIVHGVAHDVTERVRAQKALHETQRRLELIARASKTGLWDWDLRTNEVYFSPEWKSHLGCTDAEVPNRFEEWENRLHPDDHDRVLGTFRAYHDHPWSNYEAEYRLRHKDGSYRWILARASVLTDGHGKPYRMLGSHIDITERKRVEEALRASEERSRLLFERNLAGIFHTTLDGRFLDCNDACARILGYASREELLEQSAWDFYCDVVDRHAFIARLQNEKSVTNLELHLKRKDGTPIWVLENSSLIDPGHGEPAFIEGTLVDVSERKRAEEALVEERHLLRTLMDNLPDHIYFKDRDSRYTRINPALAKAFGLSDLAEAVGKTDFDFFTPEHAQPAFADEQEIIRTGQPVVAKEEKETWPDGRETWVSTTKMPLRDAAGRIVGTFGMSRDITARKRTDEALRASERRYRLLFERNLAGVYRTTVDGRILDCNEAFARLYGYSSREEILSCQAWELYHSRSDREAFIAHLKAQHELVGVEYCLRRKDGIPVWVLENSTLFEGGDDAPLVIEGTCIDITERKWAEEALAESEERFRSLVQNATVGIYRTNSDGHILMANPALVRMLGFNSFQELASWNLEREGFAPGYPRSAFRERIEREGEVKGFEAAWTRRDGSVAFVRESTRAVRAADGKVLYYDGIVEDVTPCKQAEESMRQLSGRLLRLQDEERRRIARELHDTTAQSLAALAINLSVVKDAAPDLNSRASISLSHSLELAEQCSHEIRILSYLLHPPLLDEAGLTSALRWYTGGFAQRSGIEVHLDISPELDRLPGDVELTLYRIVQEGLTNIHLHSGSKTARIRLERRPDQVVLTVADEGRGIPSRVSERADGYAPGLGVGIPGMQERMRQLGGRLEISSSSQGTTLTAIAPVRGDET